MKSPILIFSTLLLCLSICVQSGCKKDDEYSGCNKEAKHFTFFENSYLEVQYPANPTASPSLKISEGADGKTVFEYMRYVNCPWIDDGDAGDWIVFEVDDNLSEFQLVNEDLATAKVFAGIFIGFAGRFYMYPARTGKITGVKLNEDTWNISIDINTNSLSYKIEEMFRK